MLIQSFPKPSEVMIFSSTKNESNMLGERRALRGIHLYHITWKYHTQDSGVVEAIRIDTKEMETASIKLWENREDLH